MNNVARRATWRVVILARGIERRWERVGLVVRYCDVVCQNLKSYVNGRCGEDVETRDFGVFGAWHGLC